MRTRIVTPRAIFAALTVAYAAVLSLLSCRPGSSNGPRGAMRQVLEVLSNLAHVPLFAGLTFGLLMIAAGGRWSRPLSSGAYALVGLAAVGFAVVDEWHQSFVPNRFAGVGDIVLDGIGIGGVILLHAYSRKVRMARSA